MSHWPLFLITTKKEPNDMISEVLPCSPTLRFMSSEGIMTLQTQWIKNPKVKSALLCG